MKITIIPNDKYVVVDGVGMTVPGMPEMDPTIHAIQFNDGVGEIEYIKPANKLFAGVESIQDVLDAFHAHAKTLKDGHVQE